jgi:negative regulator of replication initiation
MSVGSTGSVSATTDVYAAYAAQDSTAKTSTDTAEEAKAESASESEGVVYEKSSGDEKKASYSINKMSAEDRAALVQQLKADQEQRQSQLLDIVKQMMTKQATTYTTATASSSDDIWKFLAKGDFTVDAATKAQAQQDISEDGYWGVTQTAQRLFDFASALAGDDEDQMKKMQEAMQKGYAQATKSWGQDLPDISSKTLEAANQLFEDYYNSKKSVEE